MRSPAPPDNQSPRLQKGSVMFETNLTLTFILLIILLGISAFFSGSETALMAISRLRLEHLAETVPKKAKRVNQALKAPDKLIGTILLGNNLVNVGMSALATALAISIWGERGIVYVTGVLTLVILIFAEITPKVYAKYFNERVSFLSAPILNLIMILFNPIVAFVTFISNKILLLIGIDISRIEKPLMTEEEIRTCIKVGWSDGALTDEERKMLGRVFTLNDKTIGEVMVPAKNMTVVSLNDSIEKIVKTVLATGYSRFPVSRDSRSDIIGFIHSKDLFQLISEEDHHSVEEILRPPIFVLPDKKIDAQLRSFKARKIHQAVVRDYEEQVVGLITLEDILEELVGSILDEHD